MGAVLTPIIMTPVFLWFGWRGAFWFTGMIGFSWVLIWALVSRLPDVRKPPAQAAAGTPAPSIKDRRFWAFLSAYALGAMPLGFVLYSAALYLARAHGASQLFLGKVLWIPPVGWELGYFFWGWICDRFLPASGEALPRLRFLLSLCAVFTVPFAATPWLGSIPLVMAVLFLEMFMTAGFIVLSLAYATRIFTGAHAALLAGSGAGSWSALLAVLMPLFGRLFDNHQYTAAFAVATAIPLAGYVGWVILDGTVQPIRSVRPCTYR
jgi:ACS family hexuronate transporter-like MFS transporter